MNSPMHRALQLARQAIGNTRPNPPVGAVIVRDGQIIGEGVTQPRGGSHAEVVAIREAKGLTQNATLFTTLEPCSYHGHTGPCVPIIVQSGISEVHIAAVDPNPRVHGSGIAALKSAGVRVLVGEEKEQALAVMEPHFKWITTGLPFVTAKYAMTMDGKTATATGHSQWISGIESRERTHGMRSGSDAVMVGIGTVLQDDPQLTVRDRDDRPLKTQPLRIVVDTYHRTPDDARILKPPFPTLLAITRNAQVSGQRAIQPTTQIVEFPIADDRVDLKALLKYLGDQEITNVLVEGGGKLLASFFHQNLVDKVAVFLAPILLGGDVPHTPWDGKGAHRIDDGLRLTDVTVEHIGSDILLTGYPYKDSK